jgi:hypothetical protein
MGMQLLVGRGELMVSMLCIIYRTSFCVISCENLYKLIFIILKCPVHG